MKPDVSLILSFVVAITLSISMPVQNPSSTPAAAPASKSAALPELARKTLDRKYKKWTMATVAPQGSCLDRIGPNPWLVAADFNGDGFADYAVEIATASGVKLVALMGWLEDFQLYELEASKDQTAPRFLGIEHRGSKFINPKTSLEDYFSTETLASYSCGKDRIVYLWVGFNFQRAVLPD